MKTILIPNELTNYIEKLTYEMTRYELLLALADKTAMSEQEWLISSEYFLTLYEESMIAQSTALSEIYNIYKEYIRDSSWYIDFELSAIILNSDILQKRKKKVENYNDFINRIYPREESGLLSINDSNVKNITLQVTQSCNLQCTYCYQHSKKNNSMSFDTAKKIIDMILDANENINTYLTSTKSNGLILDFIGGEPLLEIELITNISQYLINELFKRRHNWAIKFMFSICSNGLLHFSPQVQNYLKKYKGLISYNITIDGDKDLHDSCRIDHLGNGSYDKAIAAIKDYWSGDNMNPITSKLTIAPENVNKLVPAIQTMVNNGYTHINLNCVHEEGWNKSHANILYWQLHQITDWLFENNLQFDITLSIFSELCGKPLPELNQNNWCGGLGLMLAFDYQGNAYPCLRYIDTSSNPNYDLFTIGNLKDGINVLDEHQQRIKCMSCVTRRTQTTDECYNCPIAQGCSWCSAHNYEVFGTVNKRATFICDMHKARSLANVYYQRKMGINFPLHCPESWAIEIIGEKEFQQLKNMEVNESG